MTTTDQDLATMAQTLEQSGEYRVLRRLPFREHFSRPTELTKVGILFDVETTGLDTASDEVVELGMVKFSYHPDGTVAAVLDTFCSFNEPSSYPSAKPPLLIAYDALSICCVILQRCAIDFVELPVERFKFWTPASTSFISRSGSLSLLVGLATLAF